MLKKSFQVILIQATGMILSFISVYLVAGDMGPVIYSLLGIRAVVVGVIGTFSHLGIETAMSREALYWMHHGQDDKVREYATQSILSRILGFVSLAPIVLGYLAFVNFTKYDGEYTVLFALFFLGACVSALNQSMSLIIRSRGGYVFSQLVNTLNGDVMGVAAILIYIFVGVKPYLIFVALGSIPVMLVYITSLRRLFKRNYIGLKSTIAKVKENRYLLMKSWLEYFRSEADGLLVSLLFPPVIIGNYAIYKKFEHIFKAFIEGFFDVLCQRQVHYKGEPENLKRQEKKIKIIQWASIGVILLGVILFSLNPDFFIGLLNLSKYDNMKIIVYAVLLVASLYLCGKYEINAISFFAPTKTVFKMGVAVFVITILSYLSLFIFPSLEGALLQRIIVWGIASFIAIVLFRCHREDYYARIYK